MPSHILTLTAPERVATALADALSAGDRPLADAAGAFDFGDGTWGVEAYFPDSPDADHLAATLISAASADAGIAEADIAAALTTLVLRPLDGTDWTDIGLDSLPPIVAGRFRVFGEHNAPPAAERRPQDLIVEASTAFGTGDHASTFLALTALDRLLACRRPANVLDLGTGTGILAIALARAVPSVRCLASDIEPVAIDMCDLNRHANGVSRQVTPLLADGLAHPAIQSRRPYDMVLANILPDPLTSMAQAIVAVMAPGAPLVIAGLRTGEEARLVSCYRARGLVLVRRLRAKEWTSLVFQKP